MQYAGTRVPSCFRFFFLFAVEFLKQVAVCPGCVGTEDLEEDLNVDDDEQHGSPESSVHSPPGLTAQTLRRHERQQQQHQQPQQHHHHQHQHQQQPLVPPDRRRRKVGSVASGMSGRSDKSAMFGYEMADLCELAIEDLMALRTKCGRWLKHIELEIEERRQEQQEVAEREEAEARAEAARRGRLRAEAEHPPDPQYDPSMPPEDGDWSGDPAADPTPDAIPEPKTEDIQQAMEDDTDKHEVVRMCPNCRMEWDVESAPELLRRERIVWATRRLGTPCMHSKAQRWVARRARWCQCSRIARWLDNSPPISVVMNYQR